MLLFPEAKHIKLKYKKYIVEDFMADKDFIDWVTRPDAESEKYWQGVIDRHPEKRGAIEEAINVLSTIRFRKVSISDQQRDSILRKTLELRYSARSKYRTGIPKTTRGLKII